MKGVDIMKISTEYSADTAIHFIIQRGTGVLLFNEAYMSVMGTGFVPMAETFDLTRFFFVKMYQPGDKGIYIRYKAPINEEVLQYVIREYAEEIAERG